jgi:SAM-dependent methyltransferase
VPLPAGKSTATVVNALAPARTPVPPRSLWKGYGTSADEYLASGVRDIDRMTAVLQDAGVGLDNLGRVLDFGCAAGRMLRAFPNADARELWGVDVSAEHVSWCQQSLSPPGNFVTTTTAPHLPFADGYFDLVYSTSVFTHISVLADAWFLELRRITRLGGYIYITIHDERSFSLLQTTYRDVPGLQFLVAPLLSADAELSLSERGYDWFAFGTDPHVQTFYSSQYIKEKWSRWAECLLMRQEAHNYQSALLFRVTRCAPP